MCRSSINFRPRKTSRKIEDRFVEGLSLYDYLPPMPGLIDSFKEHGVTELTRLLVDQIEPEELAALIYKNLSISPSQISHGLTLVPIPSSKDAYRQRGFSPANEVCRAFLPALKPSGARVVKLLKRSRSVADQSTLATGERWQNQQLSMQARHDFSGPIILIDDIVTTGASLIEARRAAEQAGATVLGFCTIAETLLKRDPNNQKADT